MNHQIQYWPRMELYALAVSRGTNTRIWIDRLMLRLTIKLAANQRPVRSQRRREEVFSFATPKDVSRVYTQICHPETGVSPPGPQITQDVHKDVRAMMTIHVAKGAFVPGLAGGRVLGQRHRAMTEKTSSNQGGKRDKLVYNSALNDASMHANLKLLLDDSDQDGMGMFWLEVS